MRAAALQSKSKRSLAAYTKLLLRTEGARDVCIHPYGEHGKQLDFAGWLGRRNIAKVVGLGSTDYGGMWRNPAGQTVTVHPKSGLGDIVAKLGDYIIIAECKGGIINTRHSGQVSRLYRSFFQTVGLLTAAPSQGRQVAVIPLTDITFRLAMRVARCAVGGIEIALVGSCGEVLNVQHELATERNN